MPTLSVCMIAKNEEKNIKDVILCAKKFADEVVVVDTGSEDKTVEIAKSLGAKVYSMQWDDDFSAARNESIKHATSDWIMWMDADDRIDDLNTQKLLYVKKNFPKDKKESYYLLIHDEQNDKDKESMWFQLRIFPRREDVFFEGRIHEQVIFSLERAGIPSKFLEVKIKHTGYTDPSLLFRKAYRNLRMLFREDEERPNQFWVKNYIGITMKMIGRYDEAVDYIREALLLVPETSNFWKGNVSLNLASTYAELGNFVEAEKVLKEAVENNKDDGCLRLFYADALLSLGKYEQALEHINFVKNNGVNVAIVPLSVGSLSRKMWYIDGVANFHLGNYREALVSLEKVKDKFADDKNFVKVYAETLLRTGRYKEAESWYGKVENKSTADLVNLGIVKESLGKYDEAEELYRQVIVSDLKNKDALLNLGQLLFRRHKYDESKSIFLKFADEFETMEEKDYPYLKGALICLANILLREGDIPTVLEVMNAILSISGLAKHINDAADMAECWCDIAESMEGLFIKTVSLENAVVCLRIPGLETQPEKTKAAVKRIQSILTSVQNSMSVGGFMN